MIVDDNNTNEYYSTVYKCEYQRTFPSFNTDTLLVLCTKDVNIEGLAPYQYASKCKECIGKNCKDIKFREGRF